MSWQAALQASDRLIVGVGTNPDNTFPDGTDFGPDYPIVTVADDDQYQVFLDLGGNGYLSADGSTVLAGPP